MFVSCSGTFSTEFILFIDLFLIFFAEFSVDYYIHHKIILFLRKLTTEQTRVHNENFSVMHELPNKFFIS